MNQQSFEELLTSFTNEYEMIHFDVLGASYDVVPPFVMNDDEFIFKNAREEEAWKKSNGYKATLLSLENKVSNPDHVYPGESITGKASLEVIKAFLIQECSNLLKGTSGNPNEALRERLIHYGIGLDCSAFVSRAIARVMNRYNVPDDIKKKTLGEYKKTDKQTGKVTYTGFLKNNTTTLCCYKAKSTELTDGTGIIRKIDSKTGREQYERIEVGDVLFFKKIVSETDTDGEERDSNYFHIRIVTSIDVYHLEEGTYIFFDTAESSSAYRRILRKHWYYNEKVGLYSSDGNNITYEHHPQEEYFHVGTPRAFQYIKEKSK